MKLLAAMDALGYELIASVNLNKARKSDQTIDSKYSTLPGILQRSRLLDLRH